MPPKSPSRLSRWWHQPGVRARLAITALALIVFGIAVAWGAWSRVCAGGACPSIAGLSGYDPEQASKVYAADGRLIKDLGEERRTVVPLKEMSPAVAAAFISIEDKRFFSHHGIDFYRIAGAFKSLGSQGFSTITMQLAGALWPDYIDRRQRKGLPGLTRKIREMRVALEIERNYSKEKILELYLNQIPMGNGAFGVDAAAQRYFGKSSRQLNVAEAAMLAALPKAPTRYNPRRNPDLAVQRRNLVIGLMRENGRLSEVSAAAWKAYPLRLSSRSDYTGVGDYFVEYVRQQMQARFGGDLYRAGLRIYTTLDLDMQQIAERALESQMLAIEESTLGTYRHKTYKQYLDGRTDAPAGGIQSPYLQGLAVTLEAATGNILVMVGGRDFDDSKFNRVVQARRQAGSTFKPFVYAAALRAGYPLNEIIDDAPVSVSIPDQPTWEPQNYDNKFQGPMTMRQGLYESRNTIAVRAGLQVGLDAVIAEASGFGLTTKVPVVPSVFIGSAEVSPLEMAAAYSAFANLGKRAVPNAILRVEDRDGKILWQPAPQLVEVMDPQLAWLITDALRDVVRHGTAFSAIVARGGFQLPAGGKTGTTNDGFDVWYMGFTADLVTGMWMGFDQPQKIIGNAQGGRLVAPAWAAMMREVYERRNAPPEWVQPEGLVTMQLDRQTGGLATTGCPDKDVMTEFFIPGTESSVRVCPLHGGAPRPPAVP